VYPLIWSRFILRNRQSGSTTLTTPEWQALAQYHYTAIVRCWNVQNVRRAIRRGVEEIFQEWPKATKLLLLHEQLLTLFGSIGSAYDNMQKCFEVEQVNCPAAFSQCCGNKQNMWSLAWLWERRHQALHKVLVPISRRTGSPSVDMSLFADIDSSWNQANFREVKPVHEIVEMAYQGFLSGMKSCWSQLYDLLIKKHDRFADKPNLLRTEILYGPFTSVSDPPEKTKKQLPSPAPSGSTYQRK
jgi:hypothetical protein